MNLRTRVREVERRVRQSLRVNALTQFGVCDRIEELTALFATDPPAFPPPVEAGILAAVEREMRGTRPVGEDGR